MQINKGEGVFVKLGSMASLLATWPVEVMGGSGGIKEKTFGREAFNEEREKGKGMNHNDVYFFQGKRNKGGLRFPFLKRST